VKFSGVKSSLRQKTPSQLEPVIAMDFIDVADLDPTGPIIVIEDAAHVDLGRVELQERVRLVPTQRGGSGPNSRPYR
jgi:hypothetical protein